MKILLTGSNGYIGQRLLPVLAEAGHEIICCVRDQSRFEIPEAFKSQISVFEVDFLNEVDTTDAPMDFEVAYYLIHSMSSSGDFEDKESRAAQNFVNFIDKSQAQQLIYLSGIVNEEAELSKHLRSRLKTENILKSAETPHTVLRAGIIVGSGSASFEIIRDLVEKLPVMVAPKWLKTKCQPIAIRNVIQYLSGVALREDCMNQVFDIGGPEILTYKQMLEQLARFRGLARKIFTVPVMSPRLSSYWLYFVTSTSYRLAVNLVNSMKVEVVAEDNRINEIIPVKLLTYRESLERAFHRIEQNEVVSSWKDALHHSRLKKGINDYIEVPKNGVYRDLKKRRLEEDVDRVVDNIFSIGGDRGWYYGNSLWKVRGFIDKLFGGVGLRRGRTHSAQLHSGDVLDFWRVLVADRENGRLLLFAEMRIPGEAWLEFKIDRKGPRETVLRQTATFRPRGLWGRAYWLGVLPFHYFIFNGMINAIKSYRPKAS